MPQPIDHTDIILGSPTDNAQVSLHLEVENSAQPHAVLSSYKNLGTEKQSTSRQLLRADGVDIRLRLTVRSPGPQITARPDPVGEPKEIQQTLDSDAIAAWAADHGYEVLLWAEQPDGKRMQVQSQLDGNIALLQIDGTHGMARGSLTFFGLSGVKQARP